MKTIYKSISQRIHRTLENLYFESGWYVHIESKSGQPVRCVARSGGCMRCRRRSRGSEPSDQLAQKSPLGLTKQMLPRKALSARCHYLETMRNIWMLRPQYLQNTPVGQTADTGESGLQNTMQLQDSSSSNISHK